MTANAIKQVLAWAMVAICTVTAAQDKQPVEKKPVQKKHATPAEVRYQAGASPLAGTAMVKRFLVAGAALAVALSGAWASPEAAMTKAGCMACHAKDKKVIGPSFKDISARYKGKNVVAQLSSEVRKGSKGGWGPIPMPPNPVDKISDADVKLAVEWILKQ